jgi:hypothetical protein
MLLLQIKQNELLSMLPELCFGSYNPLHRQSLQAQNLPLPPQELGDGIWLMDLKYLYEKNQNNLLQLGVGLRGRDHGGKINNVQYKSNQNCHYKSCPVK